MALWVPSGGIELTRSESAELDRVLTGLAGRRVSAGVLSLMRLLGAARPAEPHYYLSLLATHGDHRGKGFGTALLRDGLARVDALGAPAYLASTNPAADNARYERFGFVPRTTITLPAGHVVTAMWRPAKRH
jgi:GNAT superfamily N-acetyltransferase